MNSNKSIKVSLLFLLLAGCSTEPALDLSKLEDTYFVICSLQMYPGYGVDFSQRVYVQKIRFLADFVFNPDDDYTLGVEGAHVTISGADTIFNFIDQGFGIYSYTKDDTVAPFLSGKQYSLRITLPNGGKISSDIITPNITVRLKSVASGVTSR